MWRETKNCSGRGLVDIPATKARIDRGEYCNVSINCNHTSGFCDCNGNGELDESEGEPWFDCGNSSLYGPGREGVLCADYCPKVCRFDFYLGTDCNGEVNGAGSSFTLYGGPQGDVTKMWAYVKKEWNTTNNFNSDTYTKWKSIRIKGSKGCSIDMFNDSSCADGGTDQFETLKTTEEGMCKNLTVQPHCVAATKPCLTTINKTVAPTPAPVPPTPAPTPVPEPPTPAPPPTYPNSLTPTPAPPPFTCYKRFKDMPASGTLATEAEIETECENFGNDCEDYPGMQDSSFNCQLADGKLFGGGPPPQITSGGEEANCFMVAIESPECPCRTCDKKCEYTVYNDYGCEGEKATEKVLHNQESVLVMANKTGSVKLHGRGCQITFWETEEKTGKSATYSVDEADKDDIIVMPNCTYCVEYTCAWIKSPEKGTTVVTGPTDGCPA